MFLPHETSCPGDQVEEQEYPLPVVWTVLQSGRNMLHFTIQMVMFNSTANA